MERRRRKRLRIIWEREEKKELDNKVVDETQVEEKDRDAVK